LQEIRATDPSSNGNPTEPFFLWYAPQIPHEGDFIPSDNHVVDIYRPFRVTEDPQTELQQGRISWFDAGLDILVNELKRTCVCGPDGAPQSMWDHTVLMLMPDHGYMLPRSKNNGDKAPTESAVRFAMVVDAPEHRWKPDGSGGQTPPAQAHAVFDPYTQHPGSHDVLPTVLDYSGLPDAEARDNYSYNTSLRPFVENGVDHGQVRKAFYGSHGDMGGVADGENRFVALPAGAIGLCESGSNKVVQFQVGAVTHRHSRPCLADGDCGTVQSGATCRTVDARRCLNFPEKLCKTDFDCGLCDVTAGPTCRSGFPDMENPSISCLTHMSCPVPKGTCAPPQLKLEIVGTGQAAWEWRRCGGRARAATVRHSSGPGSR
jgi:hypothetical protein